MTYNQNYLIQLSLQGMGLYNGKLDGDRGPMQKAAEKAYDQRVAALREADRKSVPASGLDIDERDTHKTLGTHKPKRIILHHTCGHFESSIDYLKTKGYAYHYMVDFDGTVVRLAPPERICNHAYGANTGSIGIAFNGDTVNGERRPHKHLTDAEVDSCVKVIRMLVGQFGKLGIFTHEEIDKRLEKTDVSQPAKKQILAAL